MITGFGVEIPLAIFFVWLYRRLVLRSLLAFHEALHDGVVTRGLVDAPFVFTDDVVEAQPDERVIVEPPGGD